MIIDSKFVFVHNPRTGGAFVRRVLKNICSSSLFLPLEEWHTPVHDLKRHDFKKFKFGVIRNPWDWYVSLYHFQQPHGKWLKLTNSLGPKNTFHHFLSVFLSDKFAQKHQDMKFYPVGNPYKKATVPVFEYMRNLDIGFFSYRYIYMFCKNYENIFYNKNIIFKRHNRLLSLDRVLRNESLSTSLINLIADKGICDKEKAITICRTCKKVNPTKHKHYSRYYTKKLINLVKYKDRLIIDKYNYKFEG